MTMTLWRVTCAFTLVLFACSDAPDSGAGELPSSGQSPVDAPDADAHGRQGGVTLSDAEALADVAPARSEDDGEVPLDLVEGEDIEGEAGDVSDAIADGTQQGSALSSDASSTSDSAAEGADSGAESQDIGDEGEVVAETPDALVEPVDALADTVVEPVDALADTSEIAPLSDAAADGALEEAEGDDEGKEDTKPGFPGFPGFPDKPDAGPESDATEPSGAGLYLVSVDYYGTDLFKIDAETGDTTPICTLDFSTYPSLTFSRENVLYASRSGNSLDIIDPCTCEITSVGSYGGYSGVNGITSDFGLNLFGVANTQDEFIAISSVNGVAEGLGPLGLNFGSTGATWSEEDQSVYAIDATTDALYTISPESGQASLITELDTPFGITVGIEMHPGNGVIYACSDDAHLLTVDPVTGEVSDLGPMLHSAFCTNLAAPWQPVECLEEL